MAAAIPSVRTIAEMRVFFTGGSGKAGRHAIRHLVDQGHRVVNGDMVPLGEPGVADLRIDLTEAGQVFNALSAYAGFDELEPGTGVPMYDAVVHFAAIPAILVRPDNETFRVNVLSTYNVIDAAVKLGIRKVIFASSETTYGICFAEGEVRPEYVPIDEEHPTVPHDSYAMSKVVNEATARSFQARSGIDIYGLRINNVIEPHEYETKFPAFVADPGLRRRNIFARPHGRLLPPLRRPRLRRLQRLERRHVGGDSQRRGVRTFLRRSAVSSCHGSLRDVLRQRQGQAAGRICSATHVAQRIRLRLVER
jgi:nucleoside-diphosphate-sugar epimerase